MMFRRISLCGVEGQELFWGFSVLRSEPPPPVTPADLPSGELAPENDNGRLQTPPSPIRHIHGVA
jgi:hypothetical protein